MPASLLDRLREVKCDREPFTPEHAKCICRLANEAADEIEMMSGMLGDISRAAADKNGEIQMLKHRISQLTN